MLPAGFLHLGRQRRFQLAITLDVRFIGTCGVRKAHADDAEAEFGRELAPETWGHGYARQASRALLAFGVEALCLQRVSARTQPGNAAAIHLAESLGFRCSAAGQCELTLSE